LFWYGTALVLMDTANNHGFFDFHYIGTHNKLMNPMLLCQFFPNYHFVSKTQTVMHTKSLWPIRKRTKSSNSGLWPMFLEDINKRRYCF